MAVAGLYTGGFVALPDEEIVGRARQGDQGAAECLIGRYRALVESKARAYFVRGADHDDVVQEGMIGLYKAIRDFRNDECRRFRPFAELCVTRHIITAVKTATRLKHIPLNRCVSLDDGSDAIALERLVDTESLSGESGIWNGNGLSEKLIGSFSELERDVLSRFLDGMTYQEIAAQVGCSTKTVDNALQRVKKKLQRVLERRRPGRSASKGHHARGTA